MARKSIFKWWYQFYAAGDCGQAGSAWRGWFPTVWGNVGVADKGEGHPLNKGNKLFPLTACAIRTLFHLRENRCPPSEKNQNGTKCRNFVPLDCKLRYGTGRTAVTGRQRSESAGRFRQGFPKKIRKLISVV